MRSPDAYQEFERMAAAIAVPLGSSLVQGGQASQLGGRAAAVQYELCGETGEGREAHAALTTPFGRRDVIWRAPGARLDLSLTPLEEDRLGGETSIQFMPQPRIERFRLYIGLPEAEEQGAYYYGEGFRPEGHAHFLADQPGLVRVYRQMLLDVTGALFPDLLRGVRQRMDSTLNRVLYPFLSQYPSLHARMGSVWR